MTQPSQQRGYTLLFAVLTATLVLGVAVFILNVSRKQFILASTARDSMFAIYAADSGIECVAGNKAALSTTNPQPISCNTAVNNQPVTPNFQSVPYTDSYGTVHADAKQAKFNFGFSYTDTGGTTNAAGKNGCAVITVIEYQDTQDPTILDTIVDSQGYNFCDASFGPDTSNARTVERELELTF